MADSADWFLRDRPGNRIGILDSSSLPGTRLSEGLQVLKTQFPSSPT
jgi:hypothetical protein